MDDDEQRQKAAHDQGEAFFFTNSSRARRK